MKKLVFAISVFVLISNSGCSQTDPKSTSKIYESCCGVEPVEFTFQQAYAFTPNVFTPNGDGVNDIFYPVVNDKVDKVWAFFISTATGDTLLFERNFIDYSLLDSYAWKGNRQDGTPYIGKFKYHFELSYDGGFYPVNGYACRVECGEDAAVFKDKEGCFFPNQIDPKGKPDPTIATNEDGCFK